MYHSSLDYILETRETVIKITWLHILENVKNYESRISKGTQQLK